jgi:hypothetical protein
VECLIKRLSAKTWREHVTTAETGYERYEAVHWNLYEFRLKGWLMRVNRSRVFHREDFYPKGV